MGEMAAPQQHPIPKKATTKNRKVLIPSSLLKYKNNTYLFIGWDLNDKLLLSRSLEKKKKRALSETPF